jgi:REP element-mobilizing transposase RayT
VTYLLTFSCYGTHLPGSAEGSYDRRRGMHRSGALPVNAQLEAHARSLMREEPVTLSPGDARMVLDTIREVCRTRDWRLIAAHVRTSHVHVIAEGLDQPILAIRDFKAYASRRLPGTKRRWARGGNARRLIGDSALRTAIQYVLHRQGTSMAVYVAVEFDRAVPALTRGA